YSDRFFRVVDGILVSDDSPEAKLRQYCGLFEATLDSGNQDKACLYGMMGAELVGLSHCLAEKVCQFYHNSEARLAALLDAGRDAGDFRFEGSAEDLAALILASMQGGLLIARVHGGPDKLHREIEQLIALVKGS
ncbi:MAG: TetR family transcriptional regulator C-terminal domain-containing protein, partial [Elainellaceae cyanobacterium]